MGILHACANSVHQASPRGGGGGEGPGDEAIAILAFKVPLTEIVLYYVIPMRL